MVIYKLTCVVNGKIYVGKATDLEARLYMHSRAYDHRRSALHRAIRKHGFKEFTVEILDHTENDEQLSQCEREWIEKLNATDRRVGYNITSGGNGGMLGYRFTDEQRALLSAQRKGRKQHPNVVSALLRAASRPKSDQTKKRMSEAAKLRGLNVEYRHRMSIATRGRKKSAMHIANLKAAVKRRQRDALGRLL